MEIVLDGYDYVIKGLKQEDIKHLDIMIADASLEQRRCFHGLREQIKNLKKWQLV